MKHRYADFDHAGWVQSNTKKTLSPLGKKVAYILGIIFGGSKIWKKGFHGVEDTKP